MQSPTINKLAAALVKVQSKLKPVPRTAENPFFNSKYADLATCLAHANPVLAEHGFAVIQTGEPSKDGEISIKTTLIHESGEWIDGVMSAKLTKNDPQGAGSAITYLRRYGFAAIIGLAQDDDDGNSATHGAKTPAERPASHSATPSRPAPKNAPTASLDAKKEELLLVDFTESNRTAKSTGKPYTMWEAQFETDSGAGMKAGTIKREVGELLERFKGKIVEVTYKAGKFEGTWEILNVAEIDDVP